MIQPFDMAWRCCETCEYWNGCRHFTSLGLVAECGPRSFYCVKLVDTADKGGSSCNNYQKWQVLAKQPRLVE